MLIPSPVATNHAGFDIDPGSRIKGMHAIVSLAFDRVDVTPLWNTLMQRVTADGTDAAAMFDMATILQSLGRTEDALQVLLGAVALRRNFCVVHGDGQGPRLLAIVTPGDFMANTPLDFLLEGSNCVLWLHYVDAKTTALTDLPKHDVAFMAIGEAPENLAVLERMRKVLADFPGPIMNNDPELISRLTRDGVSAMLANEPSILSPRTFKLMRQDLMAIASGTKSFDDCAPGLSFPLVVRPIGTHAGHGMEHVANTSELALWLDVQSACEIYVAPFIDFRGPDGLFNKQRIIFIKGRPFASHMALSEHWIVHYLSAGMAESPEKRAVEQAWMENFDTDFAVRHQESFAALYRHIGLDYFGIDSAELPDGRLLVFELDVAMVVHNMDNAVVYPYKHVAMRKLFNAFVEGLAGKEANGKDEALLNCLISGGDERLDCDEATGLNMYGYGPSPRPQDFAFSSSTASTISASAFAAVSSYHADLLREAKHRSAADIHGREMAYMRTELLRLLGLEQGSASSKVDAIMATSGTDIHLFAAALLAYQDDQPLMTITLTGSETGSGVKTAASGRHFMSRVSSDRPVAKGEELVAGYATRNMTVAVRNADGTLRSEEEVESELRGAIELARAAGLRCLLVVTDVSKTNLIAPGLDTVFRLKARFGAMLDIMIDACQFRVSAATIRAYLGHEFLVAITGSKFLAGPIFSGALLCPPQLSDRLKLRQLPAALGDYCAKADWPAGWAARDALPHRANFGLLLRWKAALFEFRRFAETPTEKVAAVMSAFADAVKSRLEQDPAFELLDARAIDRSRLWDGSSLSCWDEIPSIFSFYLRNPHHRSGVLNATETAMVYKDLAAHQSDVAPIRLGQPIRCADFGDTPASALRICLSAPLIVQACASADGLDALISQAMAALDRTAHEAAQFAAMPIEALFA
jgi:hypothetical protein